MTYYYVTINFPGSNKPYTYALDADNYKKLTPNRRTLRFPQSASSHGTYYQTVRIVCAGETRSLAYYVNKQLSIQDDGTVTVSYYNRYAPVIEPKKPVAAPKKPSVWDLIRDLTKTFFWG